MIGNIVSLKAAPYALVKFGNARFFKMLLHVAAHITAVEF
jgi:hypothetical protein